MQNFIEIIEKLSVIWSPVVVDNSLLFGERTGSRSAALSKNNNKSSPMITMFL